MWSFSYFLSPSQYRNYLLSLILVNLSSSFCFFWVFFSQMDGAPENATNWVFHNPAFSFYKICKGLSEVFYLLSKPSPLSLSLLVVPTLKRCSVSLLSPHQSCLPSPTCATRQRCEQIWYLTSPRCGSSQQSFSRLHPESFLKGFFSGINHVIKLPVSFPKFSARFENVIDFKDFRKTLDICFNRTKFFRHHLDLLAHYVISEQVSTSNNIKKTQKTDRQTDMNCFSNTL